MAATVHRRCQCAGRRIVQVLQKAKRIGYALLSFYLYTLTSGGAATSRGQGTPSTHAPFLAARTRVAIYFFFSMSLKSLHNDLHFAG